MVGQPGYTESWLGSMAFLALFFVVFYILIIMPRKKQEKQHDELVQNLKPRDKIITIGGVYGEVKKVKDKTFIIKTSETGELEVLKSAVAQMQPED